MTTASIASGMSVVACAWVLIAVVLIAIAMAVVGCGCKTGRADYLIVKL